MNVANWAQMATTPEEFIATLPPDRAEAVARLREVIKENLQPGFEEGMQYGGIGYFIPHSIFPAGYHCDPKQPLNFLTISNTKGHIALHALGLYCMPELKAKFVEDYESSGNKIDMGAGCIRFKKPETIQYDAIGRMVRGITCEGYIAQYSAMIPQKKRK